MDNSFFGFDTSVPFEDDGATGQIAEPSEEEYDALNDETFGSATNGDWEEAHETLVRLTDCVVHESAFGVTLEAKEPKNKNISSQPLPSATAIRARNMEKFTDSDLELNLSGMKLDDVDLCLDDNESLSGVGDLRLDPSVWASNPFKTSTSNTYNDIQGSDSHSVFDFGDASAPKEYQNIHGGMVKRIDAYGVPTTPKFCTLEDIERNIIVEQTIRKQQELQSHSNDSRHQHLTQKQHILKFKEPQGQPNSPPSHYTNPLKPTHYQHNLQNALSSQMKGLPGFPLNQVRPNSNFTSNMAQHPFGNMVQHQTINVGGSLGSGFPVYPNATGPHLQQQNSHQPPHTLLSQHGLSSNFHRTLPSNHLPIALNNFAMHPNFNAMRAAATVTGIHSASLVQQQQQAHIVPHPHNSAVLLNTQQSNSMYNMFNMRLVQEIQQNHPLLQNSVRQTAHIQQPIGINLQHNLVQQRGNNSGNLKAIHQRREGGSANGNLPPDDFDQYANLMSTRDKHWLIGIQLSQLNTDTPYIDDFYYTVYREKKAVQNGNIRHSQAHKDNQLNHPLTQPKGHAQLILVQLGNKNGARNGQHRECRNSESTIAVGNNSGNISNNQDQKTPYVFTPLKFENSLGKLQYGSVTAPRKIIDADIMGSELTVFGVGECIKYADSSNGINSTNVKSNMSVNSQSGAFNDIASSAHRKSRHILLHIETLFRIVLKLEDLNNPIAIATIIMKKNKESERIAALEQLENAHKIQEERMPEISSSSAAHPALKNKFTYEIEKKEVLVAKLIAGLSQEEVPVIMNVRKGKALIRRIMPYIEDHEVRWTIWMGVFSSLQNVVKKDRADADGALYALYPEFKKQVREANFKTIVKISSSIPLNEKKSNVIFCSKFGISSLVCLVIQAENIYRYGNDDTHIGSNKGKWRNFLDRVSMSLNRTIQNQTICAEIESDSIQPMMDHFARFKDLKLDSLLQLITEAKQQIN